MNKLWRAFIRKLPKRVLLENKMFYPQVWFIWWHYVWYGVGEFSQQWCFDYLDNAKSFVEHNWDPIKKPEKKVVWRSK